MKLRSFILSILLGVSAFAFADNETQTVAKVTAPVTLSGSVDYHISSATPFATTGSIDITNPEKAVVIFDALLPSKAKNYIGSVTINGEKAVSGTNCQLRVFRAGCMLLPYPEKQVLSVYTEANYGGSMKNSYDVNTIYSLANDKEFNNQIRSFKLKRGYMVCFSNQSNGQGYSRVFIADKADLEIASLPKVLNGRISYIRISKWNNVIKRGWAGYWSDDVQEMLNTGWAYNWDASTHSDWTDREYISQRHHIGWPGIADVGNVGSANILAHNEPDNKADGREHPATVDEVLAEWPQLMAEGRRLGSPAVSGDYNWLYQFIDSIDARGWRCDFIAVHAYWYSDKDSWRSQLENISRRCGGRPIWITEMNYGANWTGWPGSNTSASDANYAIEKQHMGPILDYLNDASYIERYAFYNNVQDCRYAVANNKLTPIGEYYANLRPAMAYNSAKEYIPRNPRTEAPAGLTAVFTPRSYTCALSWKNPNGDLLDNMYVERKKGLKGEWERLKEITIEDSPAKTYSYKENVAEAGNYYYRIHGIDYNGKDLYSSEVLNAVSGTEGNEEVQWGKVVADNDEDTYNFFEYGFDEMPAVVFGAVSSKNFNTKSVNALSQISKVGDKFSYFSSHYFPWNGATADVNDYSKGTEVASYLALKPGSGTMGNLHYEGGVMKNGTSNLYLKGEVVEYKFKEPFETVPLVFVTPISTNKAFPCEARVWDVTKEGFKVVLTRQKGKESQTMVQRRATYLAIEKGTTQLENKVVIVNDTPMTFTSTNAKAINYGGWSLDNPYFLCQLQTYDRKVTSQLRTGANGPAEKMCQVRLIPDTTDPDNLINYKNPFKETVGWICIGTDKTTGVQTPETSVASDKLDIQVTNGQLVVRDASASWAKVFTLGGSLVAQGGVKSGEATFSLASLPVGVMVVKTSTGKAMKFVVRR